MNEIPLISSWAECPDPFRSAAIDHQAGREVVDLLMKLARDQGCADSHGDARYTHRGSRRSYDSDGRRAYRLLSEVFEHPSSQIGKLLEGSAFIMKRIDDIDLTGGAFKTDPYPFYARWRDETPVFRTTLADGQIAWLVTRYDDVLSVLKDGRFAKDKRQALSAEQLARLPWMPSIFKPLEENMLDLDEPDHSRLRAFVHQAFSPRLVDNMRAASRGVDR